MKHRNTEQHAKMVEVLSTFTAGKNTFTQTELAAVLAANDLPTGTHAGSQAYSVLYSRGWRKSGENYTRLSAVLVRSALVFVQPTAFESGVSSYNPDNQAAISDRTALVRFQGLDLDATNPEEPRVPARVLAERAGMSEPRAIKKIIESNRAELEMHGEISVRVYQTRSLNPMKEGSFIERDVSDSLLNEAQSCTLLMHMRTEKATAFRVELVKLFMAWKQGRLGDGKVAALEARMAKTDENIATILALLVQRQELKPIGINLPESLLPPAPSVVSPLASLKAKIEDKRAELGKRAAQEAQDRREEEERKAEEAKRSAEKFHRPFTNGDEMITLAHWLKENGLDTSLSSYGHPAALSAKVFSAADRAGEKRGRSSQGTANTYRRSFLDSFLSYLTASAAAEE